MKEAKEQRDRNIAALDALKITIQTQTDEIGKLTNSLSDFFLKHFP